MGRDVRGHERSRTKTPLPQWAGRRLPCCLMHLSLSKPLQPPPLCPPFSSSALILPAPAFQPAWPQFPFPVTPNCDISLSGKSQYPHVETAVPALSLWSVLLSHLVFLPQLCLSSLAEVIIKLRLRQVFAFWDPLLVMHWPPSSCLGFLMSVSLLLGCSHFSLFICLS